MSDAKHSPGPVIVSGKYLRMSVDGGDVSDFAQAYRTTDISEEVAKENAARLAACWNACDGIADPSAVPELLAACVAWLNEMDPDGPYDSDEEVGINGMIAAVAKLTGKIYQKV